MDKVRESKLLTLHLKLKSLPASTSPSKPFHKATTEGINEWENWFVLPRISWNLCNGGMTIQVKPSSTPRSKTLWKYNHDKMISSIKKLVEHAKANHIPPMSEITGQITIKQVWFLSHNMVQQVEMNISWRPPDKWTILKARKKKLIKHRKYNSLSWNIHQTCLMIPSF